MNLKKIEAGTRLVLEGIGVNLYDRNFKDTPRRVAKVYQEMFTPKRNNMRTFLERYDQMLILRNHEVHTLCPHHLLPVVMRVHVAYIPNGRVLGLSKLARAVESQLTQPIMQETLTQRVVQELHDRLSPKGVACIAIGTHGCMRHRGVRTGGDVVSSAVSGVFLTNPSTKEEFLRLLGRM